MLSQVEVSYHVPVEMWQFCFVWDSLAAWLATRTHLSAASVLPCKGAGKNLEMGNPRILRGW